MPSGRQDEVTFEQGAGSAELVKNLVEAEG
jgi:hypothetical protein